MLKDVLTRHSFVVKAFNKDLDNWLMYTEQAKGISLNMNDVVVILKRAGHHPQRFSYKWSESLDIA